MKREREKDSFPLCEGKERNVFQPRKMMINAQRRAKNQQNDFLLSRSFDAVKCQ